MIRPPPLKTNFLCLLSTVSEAEERWFLTVRWASIAGDHQRQKGKAQADGGKYARYTQEQVEALERVYAESPKPSSLRRQLIVAEFPILANIEPKQIKVWFQNRRCRDKQKKENSHMQNENRNLSAMTKLLLEENERLQKQSTQLVYEGDFMCQQHQTIAITDNSCRSVVTSGQHRKSPTSRCPQRDASSPAGLLTIAKDTLAEFLSKAIGTAVKWVQMPGMKREHVVLCA